MKTKDQLVNLGLTDMQVEQIMLLESEMMEHAVKFSFKKKDGSLRAAVGTLVRDDMRAEDGSIWEPKGEIKADAANLVKYWDMGAMAWRCFNVFNLVSIEG